MSQLTVPETAADSIGEAAAPRRILFVCTGNTCRSPMAAALFNDMAMKQAAASAAWLGGGTDRPTASSAGLSCPEGMPISDHAARALREAGIRPVPGNDWLSHATREVTADMLRDCDVIVGITRAHAMTLMMAFPELSPRIMSMPVDIPDPYGQGYPAYRACLEALQAGIRTLFFPEDE